MTDEQIENEEGIVRGFILPQRQSRYLEFIKTPRRRGGFLKELAHFKHLDPLCAKRITPDHQNPGDIAKLLRAKGAPEDCWVISERADIDGRKMKLDDVLKEIVGNQMGTFVSCKPAKLGYFEDEDCRFILENK
ncbi:MAG: hypothetical protein ACRD5M_04290 [Candidatus Acidiferrales bacterium]